MSRLNPFRYGGPVPPACFIGRSEFVTTVFSRISNGDRTAIVGPPHIGKTSLLSYVGSDGPRRANLGEKSKRFVFTDFDCHLLASSDTPIDFWAQMVPPILVAHRGADVERCAARAKDQQYCSAALDDLYVALDKSGWKQVLLIDEFDSLLGHPNFCNSHFFGTLRSIARRGSLVLVSASRLDIGEMNRRTENINNGSPFFNTGISVRLKRLQPDEIDSLIDASLAGTTISFGKADRACVVRLAGNHPYLVQAAAAALFDAIVSKRVEGDAQYSTAGLTLLDRCDGFFDDTWRHLSNRARAALALLALAEMHGRSEGREFDVGEIAKQNWYTAELKSLCDVGLVDSDAEGWRFDWANFVVWHGAKYRVSSSAFLHWIAEGAIADTRDDVQFDKWLRDREFIGLLTRAEQEKLSQVLKAIPKSTLSGAGKFIGSILKGWSTAVPH